jgi:ribosomal protein S17E
MAYRRKTDAPRQGRPPQYLFTITDDFAETWDAFCKKVQEESTTKSKLLRQAIQEYITPTKQNKPRGKPFMSTSIQKL